nr:metal-dependent hydrolase [Coxiellaceae bacterium]
MTKDNLSKHSDRCKPDNNTPESGESVLEVRDLSVKLIRRAVKYCSINVLPPAGEIQVIAPDDVPEKRIRLFLIRRRKWIKKQQDDFITQEKEPPGRFVSGESHYLLGRQYRLKVADTEDKPHIAITDKYIMTLFVNKSTTTKERQQLFREWYREQLKKHLAPIIRNWENRFGTKVADYHIRRMRKRWGSCHANKKRIIFNLELAKKPLSCIEYVVVHEIAHFFEANHNKKFWALVSRKLPEWRRLREELNNLPLSCELL